MLPILEARDRHAEESFYKLKIRDKEVEILSLYYKGWVSTILISYSITLVYRVSFVNNS